MNKKLKVLPILAMGLMLVACNGGTSSSSKPTSKNDDVNFTLKVGSYVELVKNDPTNTNTIAVSSAAVILKDDTIVDAYFDVLQAPFTITDGKVSILTTGKHQTEQAGDKVIETKQELKDRYAMAKSDKTKEGEWYVQAGNFAKYTVGKTISEVTSKNYKNAYNPNGTEIVSGCSISQTNFTTALKVITDTKTFKAPANTVSAGLGYKVSALSADNVLTVTLAGSATDKDGKIYETSINAYQIPLMVSSTDTTKIAYNPINPKNISYAQLKAENFKDHTVASGKDTYYTEVLSKRELKDLYAMKDKATAGEWFTQANSFAAYAKNKNVSVLQENLGKYKATDHNPNGTVEVAGCTISMDDFATSIIKSNTNKSGLKAK